MHKKGFIALMLSFTLAASALPVTATENSDMLGNTEWTVADDIEDVSKALSENLNDTYFEEAVIDVTKNSVSVDGQVVSSEVIFGEYYSNNKTVEDIRGYIEEIGFEVQEEMGNQVTIVSPYQSKRILVFADELKEEYGAESIISYPEYDEYILQFSSEEDTMIAYESIKDKYDCFVDRILTMDSLLTSEEINAKGTGEDVGGKEESSKGLSWGREAMNMDESILTADYDRDVKVAVIDSGLSDEHKIFSTERLDEKSYDFVEAVSDLTDPIGHGTAVTGIIEECTPDNVQILALRVFNEEGLTTDSLVCTAIQYAIENNADIINMSFGGTTDEMKGMKPYDTVIDMAYEKGILCVCAAGNRNDDVADMYPANNDKTVAVSGHDRNFELADQSNYGSMIDFSAPGEKILCALPSGTEAEQSGTSFAAPHVSAALACILSAYPETETAQGLYDKAKEFVKDIGDEGKDVKFGWGAFDLSGVEGDAPDKDDEGGEEPEHIHDYEDVVASPTCTEKGFTRHVCRTCQESYVDSETEATGHVHTVDEETTIVSTCIQPGKKTVVTRCMDCGIVVHSSETEIPFAEHQVGTAIQENIHPATCTENGYYDSVVYCSVCHKELSRKNVSSSKAKGHQFGPWIETKEATCTGKGSKKRVCSTCGFTEYQDVNASGHVWKDSYTVDKVATCTTDGSQSIHCTKCSAIKDSQTISAKGHSYTYIKDIKQPTCTKDGYERTYCVCEDCGDTYEYTTYRMPAKGHAWDKGTILRKASKEKEGIMQYQCMVCRDSYQTKLQYNGSTGSNSSAGSSPQLAGNKNTTVISQTAAGHVSTVTTFDDNANKDVPQNVEHTSTSNGDVIVTLHGLSESTGEVNSETVENLMTEDEGVPADDSTTVTKPVIITEENASGVRLFDDGYDRTEDMEDIEDNIHLIEDDDEQVPEKKGKLLIVLLSLPLIAAAVWLFNFKRIQKKRKVKKMRLF